MNSQEILKQALELKPQEKFLVLEGLLESLDMPDKDIDKIWYEESGKRLKAYRNGKLEGIPMEEIFEQ